MDNIEITGIRYTVDEPTKKYVFKKIGALKRFLPRHARRTFSATVVIKQVDRTNGNKYECDAKVVVPGKVINATDTTMNAMAAVDVVEAKLADQLRKYKEINRPAKGWRARISNLRRKIS